ncbi:hypothetical protein D9757_008382 [Collybiopsis confluens]|uniref:S-adenosyl-L-methionine-dependent methyltransferase n=1 Tax=Collybiopsis confluens TaxID=2823264 RepID=A0A8H5HHI1_9AGAR|nr:hypothetical protein D9757_012077 [Collybiopsis confluens]KAF5383327.1 hypothetical protein D9757_008382 [Collybiopsis confluens]
MANLDNTHITKLRDLINEAVEDIITGYAAIGHAVPSLDTLEPGPFPVPEAVPAQMRKAIQIIEAACTQLSYTVALPGSVLLDKALVMEEPACLQVATEARIADLLLDRPEGLATSELATLTGLDEAKLTRILRFLATKHCFKEVTPSVFANNRLSIRLLTSDPMSSIIGFCTDEPLRSASYLNEFLTTSSGAEDDSPFRRWSGHRLYEFYLTEQGLGRGKRFTRAMTAWGDATGKGFLPKVYPWESKHKDTTVCDVGSGNGWVSIGLLRAQPHLKVILQDQPQVIETARELWATELPVAIERGRVDFIPFDFFKDAAAKDCDFYYLRSILYNVSFCFREFLIRISNVSFRHNWPNSECELILNNIRKSMKPGSKLLLDEYVLIEACRTQAQVDSHDLDFAPEPLLPNYGAGRIRAYNMDISMMNVFGGQERTFTELVSLCEKCGFKFSKLYGAGEMDLLEFSPI